MKNSRLPYAFPALRAVTVSAGALVLLGACAQQQASEESEGRTPVMSESSRVDDRPPLLTDDGVSAEPGEDGEAVSEREALESCNAYANAIVARDRRIDRDRRAGLDTGGPLSGAGASRLSESMRIQGEENAYEQHFSNCMENRGYAEE